MSKKLGVNDNAKVNDKRLGINDDDRLVRLAQLMHKAETEKLIKSSAVRRLMDNKAKSKQGPAR